ncbi:MAG: hypothetical protein ABGY24_06060, partial [bacterium]
ELDTEDILATREIPWEIYSTARLIHDLELQLLRRYDDKKGGVRGSWGPGSPSTSTSTSSALSSRLSSSTSLHRWRLLCGEVRCEFVRVSFCVFGLVLSVIKGTRDLICSALTCTGGVDTSCRMDTSMFRQC